MSNKRKICNLGIKNPEYLTNSIQEVTTKAPEGFELKMYGSQSPHLIHSAMEKVT